MARSVFLWRERPIAVRVAIVAATITLYWVAIGVVAFLLVTWANAKPALVVPFAVIVAAIMAVLPVAVAFRSEAQVERAVLRRMQAVDEQRNRRWPGWPSIDEPSSDDRA